MDDVLDGVPKSLLGYKIKTRTQIILTCLVPATLELFVYVTLTTADVALIVQHFRDDHAFWAYLTLSFVLAPAVLCFVFILLSPSQWPGPKDGLLCQAENVKFLFRQLAYLMVFPVGCLYRFCRKIFWSVEALFYDRESYERYHAVSKAAETSPFELYHFLQAFVQAAPQIMLQMNIILQQDIFRNFETTTAQVISIIFSLIKMAMTIMCFQRFESQKVVGRTYPWMTPDQICERVHQLRHSTSRPEDILSQKSSLRTSTWTPSILRETYPKMEELIESESDSENDLNCTDDDKLEKAFSKTNLVEDTVDANPSTSNRPDDDLIEEDFIRPRPDSGAPAEYDRSPSHPPPPRPTSLFLNLNSPIQRFSRFKDMLIFDAETFIKDHVPRLPPGMFEHPPPGSPRTPTASPADEPDFIMPTRRRIINGIEQDDFIGKYVSFAGWALFLVARMLALSVFAAFFPYTCLYLLLAHYLLMLVCLLAETRCCAKWTRNLFYIFLAYVYVFCVLELKVRFVHLRTWYIGYFALAMGQNIGCTTAWYAFAEWDSWWLEFVFAVIVGAGTLSVTCLTFYYFALRPKDKVLFVNEEDEATVAAMEGE